MGLSDDEQQQLARIERELLRADPRLASTLAVGRPSHLTASVLQWLLGFGLLITGMVCVTIGQAMTAGILSVTGLIVMRRAAIALMTG